MSEDLPSTLPEAAVPTVETPKSRSNLLREIVETALLTAVIFLVVNTITGRFRIEGSSMEPNLHDGEYVIIDRVSYVLHPPERGDVIVFVPPTGDKDYIKRVMGLPGDTVEVRNSQVIVNGKVLDEPYLNAPTNYTYGPQTIEPGHYFVLGDNRNNSSDSHSWGAIASSTIIGRAWFVYWPPTDWGAVPHYSYAATQ
ncbi:MAG TPA: signal peptidase I [Anaerolineae bacterium]|nr:signal peptidase I [Anaerolineae bacterium]